MEVDAGPFRLIPSARSYHHTCPVTLFYGLREALALIAEEGLAASWRRHEHAALRLHAGLEGLGLRLLVENPQHRLPTVTAILLPDKVDWPSVTRTAMARSVPHALCGPSRRTEFPVDRIPSLDFASAGTTPRSAAAWAPQWVALSGWG